MTVFVQLAQESEDDAVNFLQLLDLSATRHGQISSPIAAYQRKNAEGWVKWMSMLSDCACG